MPPSSAPQPIEILDTYFEWVHRLVQRHVGQRVLDIGCGRGMFTSLVAGSAEYVMAADLDPDNLRTLGDRFACHPHVEIQRIDARESLEPWHNRSFDTVVCLDLLEDIDDDVQVIENLYRAVQPAGSLVVKVPAGRWLFGAVDLASGHYRRYSLGELTAKTRQVGWEPLEGRHERVWRSAVLVEVPLSQAVGPFLALLWARHAQDDSPCHSCSGLSRAGVAASDGIIRGTCGATSRVGLRVSDLEAAPGPRFLLE